MSSQRAQRFLQILDGRLPFALPLYRRIQSTIKSPHAHLFASFELDESFGDPPTCFALAYVDRSGRPERQGWVYLSAEETGVCRASDAGQECPNCENAVRSIVNQIARLPLPDIDSNSINKSPVGVTGGDPSFMSHFNHPDVFLLGSVHNKVARILDSLGLIVKDMPGLEFEYNKYIFDVTSMSADDALPAGLRWGQPSERDLEIVVSRSKIPRQVSSLKTLPSVAVFPAISLGPFEDGKTNAVSEANNFEDSPAKSTAIAWAFLRPDASLSSLHVEPEYRGRGLAKKVASRLMREGMSSAMTAAQTHSLSVGSARWGHADVATDNAESNGVCRSLGGRACWSVYWLRIDLKRVKALDQT